LWRMKKRKKAGLGATLGKGQVELQEVERLLKFMAQHGLEEFEYARGGLHIRLKRAMAGASRQPVAVSLSAPADRHGPAPEIVVAGAAPSPSTQFTPSGAEGLGAGADAGNPAASRESSAAAAHAEDLNLIKSPIVGTFYSAPSPGAEPFVKLGDQVRAGQVVCIIEAMKLMNEIESDAAGEVVRIYVENGQPVEYGESLFALRPARMK